MNSPRELSKALQAKRRKQRRLRWIGVGVAALVLALVGVITWLFAFSSVFATSEVRISGTTLLSEQQIMEAAAIPMGSPLATLNLNEIRERVAQLAPVAEVTVNRQFPHTIEITITERSLVYLWADGEVQRWVDAEGVAFHEGGEAPAGTLIAQVEAPDQRLLKDVATVVQAVKPVLGEKITLIRASAVDQIEIRLADGDTVVWGSAEDSALKADVLSVLLSQDATVYDVSAPQAPTTR